MKQNLQPCEPPLTEATRAVLPTMMSLYVFAEPSGFSRRRSEADLRRICGRDIRLLLLLERQSMRFTFLVRTESGE